MTAGRRAGAGGGSTRPPRPSASASAADAPASRSCWGPAWVSSPSGSSDAGADSRTPRSRDFPAPTVIGHSGELVAGTLAGRTVLVQSGRFHLYEGHPAAYRALPVRVFAELGVGR